MKTFLILLISSFLIFFLDGKGYLNGVKGTVQIITLPVQYSFFAAGQNIKNSFSFLTFWKSGEARIRNLELRNLELGAAKNEAERLEKENKELKKQLGANISKNHVLLPAPVLGLDRYLQIGVGINDGVKEGMIVVYLDNLVGKIIRVLPRSSFVMLPTDPQSKIPVKIKEARGLVSGQFNSSQILDRVGQNEEINLGDLIFTLEDLVVGKVDKIISQQTDIFKKAIVKPILNYSDLTTVFVIND
ncbi:rod shape-determining protein MreC [Candidatus Gottesmanbacteria bacterium]|nr:rod shape-determining protein MreC [Candidatus Gottesmanbacteria bacterium]